MMSTPTNEFSDAFSTAFDPAAVPPAPPLPALPDECWPVDHTCCQTEWDADPEVWPVEAKANADALAVMTLRMLTGYRVGGCPVTVRPCRDACRGQTWRTFPVLASSGSAAGVGWVPQLQSGTWVNMACGCGQAGCSCTTVCDLVLPGEPSQVTAVWQDGLLVDPSAYRLDGNRLTRIDAACWPLCQDMTAADDADGAFAVTYYPAARPDGLASWAAGRLACEYVKACTGGDCALPPTVTQLARAGVTYSLDPGLFATGLTGLRDVDAFILRWNPNLLKGPSLVWSPDVDRGRIRGRAG